MGQSLRVPSMDVDMSSTAMVPSPQLAMSPQTPPTPSNSGLFDSPVSTPAPSPGGDTSNQMMVDTDNFILNQLQLIQQQNQQKQQFQEQQKQQQLEQQKQQQLQLQKQQQLEQKRQQQQQQQMQAIQQEQQQQKQQQEQILQLLQNTQLKNVILNSSNATNIIEELLKGLQNQQQTLQQTQNQLQTQSLLQSQSRLQTTQNQLSSQNQQHTQLSQAQTLNLSTSADNSLLLGLINTNSPTSGSNSQKLMPNNSKPKQKVKFGTTSILEALSADENQCARNKMSLSQKTQTTLHKRTDMSNVTNQQAGVKKDQAGFIIPSVSWILFSLFISLSISQKKSSYFDR